MSFVAAHSRSVRRWLAIAAVPSVILGLAVASAGPAAAATTPPVFCSDGTCVPGPAPIEVLGVSVPQTPICYDGYCVPQYWYNPTSTITNDGLYQLFPLSYSEANTASTSTVFTNTYTISATLQASVNVSIPISEAEIAGGNVALDPGAQAQIGAMDAVACTVNIPPDSIGTVYPGILYTTTSGTIYHLSYTGQITSQPAEATVPNDWGCTNSVTPITNS
jgi:hypothetical protein